MRVIYLTPSSFRTVNAGALRNVNVAKALASQGHEVLILSGDHMSDRTAPEWTGMLNERIRIQASGASRTNVLCRMRRLLLGPSLVVEGAEKPDVILAYNPTPLAYALARCNSRPRRILLVIDISEWLGIRDQPGGLCSPHAWLYEVFMRLLPRLISRSVKAIAISEEMGLHLSSSGGSVLVVPPLSAVPPGESTQQAASGFRIVVSGSGLRKGGKDSDALVAIMLLAEKASLPDDTVIEILGEPDGMVMEGIRRKLGANRVVAHGWLPWYKSLDVLRAADCMILLRDPTSRRNRMGFPSKVIESLSLGVPVITNRVGVNYESVTSNCLVLTETCSADDLQRAIADMVARRGRRSVETAFHPEAWGEKLGRFIGD